MKRIFKRNQIAITSLAIMIAVAGYINFSKTDFTGINDYADSKDTLDSVPTMDISDGDALLSGTVNDSIEMEDPENIGDAVLTQAQAGEYVAGAKLEREQAHSKSKETLNQIIENEKVSDSVKEEAIHKLALLTDTMEKESATEELLASKGFENAVVAIDSNNVDVILNYDELSQTQRAQIEDIVTRKTEMTIDKIVISKMKSS